MGSKSRIDFFLVSETLLHTTPAPEAAIDDGFLADHNLASVKVNIGKAVMGKSYWKFNNRLLTDEDFIQAMQIRIPEIIKENSSPGVSKSLLLRTVLCVLRGDIISYSSRKKKERNMRFGELEEKINNPINHEQEVISAAIAERNELIESATKANMFQCKANWRRFAEKGTEYFHGLQKRDRFGNMQKAMKLTYTKGGAISGRQATC